MRRFWERGGWILVLPLAIPVFLLLIAIALVIVTVMGIWAAMRWLYHQWPRHRRALRLARKALQEKMPGREVADWRIARRQRGKVVVQATLHGNIDPPFQWMCAVWDAEERFDELGTWRFQHGVRARHAVRAYEAAQATGVAWPTSTAELIERLPQQELPAQARPGLYPHEGTVVVRHTDGFHFYFSTMTATPEYFNTVQSGFIEAFDAECRRIHYRQGEPLAQPVILPAFLAPVPPLPPDKVIIERLRHHLLSRTTNEEARQRLRLMTPPELVEYGLEHHGELEDVTIEDIE